MSTGKKPKILYDQAVPKDGRWVRCWKEKGEWAVQIWNSGKPEGEPDGDWLMPKFLGATDIAISQALAQTRGSFSQEILATQLDPRVAGASMGVSGERNEPQTRETKMSKTNETKGSPADVVIDETLNISRARELSERGNEVIQRAIDIFDNGQTQPVRCFPGKGGKPTAYIGFTRHAAVELIRRGFSVPTGEVHLVAETDAEGKPTGKEVETKVTRTIHDPEFPLLYVVDDLPEADAVARGAADNYQSFAPNDLDLARTAKALQDRFEWTDAEVTRRLGVSDPFKIGRIKKLLTAPAVIQDAVATDKLATSAALEIVTNTSGEGRKAAVAAVKTAVEAGKKGPTQSQVKKIAAQAVEAAEREEEGKGPPRTPKSAPTAPEIRVFFGDWVKSVHTNDGEDKEGQLLKDVLTDINKYLNGKLSETTLAAKLDDHFGVFQATKVGKFPEAKVGKSAAPETPAGEEKPKRTGKGSAAARSKARAAKAAEGGEGTPAATEQPAGVSA